MKSRFARSLVFATSLLLSTAQVTFAAGRDVTVAISSTSFATTAVRLAKELGFFERHGLDVRVVSTDSANAALGALFGGSVDVATAGPGEIVAARSRGQPIVLVADIYRGFGASLILSKSAADKTGLAPDAPASQRLKALGGMLIAVASATSTGAAAFNVSAKQQGADIRLVYMSQPSMIAAMESGAIQGFVASAPYWAVPVTKGSGVLWLSGPKGDLPAENLPVSYLSLQALRRVAEADPDTMRKLSDAVYEVGEAVGRRPAEVKAALAKLYPDLDRASVDLLFAAESSAWRTKPLTVQDMAHEIAFVKSLGAPLPQIDSVDPADLLFPRPK